VSASGEQHAARTAVIQVKQGIGDVIWHLPFIRAIAAAEPAGAVTFLAPPTSLARELLQGEASIAEVQYFGHGGSELQRGLHLARLVALLRRARLRRIWILDRTVRPAFAAMLARIPERIGVGFGPQRLFITNAGIDQRHADDLVMDWLRALLAAMHVPMATTEPNLKLPAATLAGVQARYPAEVRPWTVLGLGASHPSKDWPDDHWKTFIGALRRRMEGTLFFVGGPANAARADAFITATAGATAINACGLGIAEAAALLRHADLFVGPDSAPMNLAAAGETPAFGLFGATPVLSYSRHIHAIEPDQGWKVPGGMARIRPEQVLARIEPYLPSR
jgi:heptosyltransferase-2